ncbi:MAG: cell division protein ZapD [Candidatus Accumulibacter sp.]|jgi:cell division protein ZapD|nr:cell division protein ZapD [Accumulibacter sp.]
MTEHVTYQDHEDPVITYEYPFSERIRTLLRLEDIFNKTLYFTKKRTSFEHHAALMGLFEIVNVTSRADLKMDVLQELERQRQALQSSRDASGVSEKSLSAALCEIEQASTALRETSGKLGQHVRDNEWLMGIKSRTVIPGGVCEFDLPSYHYWRHLAPEERQNSLNEWLQPLLPLNDSLSIILRLLRKSGEAKRQIAQGYTFQITPQGASSQMLRVSLAEDIQLVPEISANKYLINIHFTHPAKKCLACAAEDAEIHFDMAICRL